MIFIVNYLELNEFLPKNYVLKKSKIKSDSKKRIYIYMIVINIFLLPINFSTIKGGLFLKKDNINYQLPSYNPSKAYNDLKKWLLLNHSYYDNLEVISNRGKILTKNKENIYKIQETGFEVIEITKIDEDFYSLEVRIGK